MTGSDARPLAGRVRARCRGALARRFGIDARALAAFRIALGLLLLADLLLRAPDLVAFYTDAGVLPRTALREQYPLFSRVSVHALSGEAGVQIALFLLAGLCAASLLVGYRPRAALLLSWLLLVSLHARNPLVLNGGDSLFRRLLFWGLFLPLGGRWSIDALRRSRARGGDERGGRAERVVSPASAALLIQVVLVYAVNAVLKHEGELWVRGDAVRYVFSLEQFTVLLGDVVAGFPELLVALGWMWLAMVSASPLLILLTGRGRALFAALFVGAHLGMALTLQLGLFPFISIAALLPFFPGFVWDAAPIPRPKRLARATRALDRALPRGPTIPVTVPTPVRRRGRQLASAGIVAAVALLLVWNAVSVGYAELPEEVDPGVDPERYQWNMFAPNPLGVDGWYVVPGELASGERVDARTGAPVRWDRPPDVAGTYPNARWRKYMVDHLWSGGDEDLRRHFAEYLCRRWNGDRGDRLVELTVAYVEQPTRLDGPEPTRRVELLTHSCAAGGA